MSDPTIINSERYQEVFSIRSFSEYTVLCGYEYDPNELYNMALGHDYRPQVVADQIDFNNAAHILRTLNEHGEGDMVYFIVPSVMWSFASEEWLNRKLDEPEPVPYEVTIN